MVHPKPPGRFGPKTWDQQPEADAFQVLLVRRPCTTRLGMLRGGMCSGVGAVWSERGLS